MDYKEVLQNLTGREKIILNGVCTGLKDRQISGQLFISEAQYYIEKGNIYAKLNLKDITDRKRRLEILKNTICPIFFKLNEPTIVDGEIVTDPLISPTLELPTTILDQESYALAVQDAKEEDNKETKKEPEVIFIPSQKLIGNGNQKRSPWPMILTIAVFAIMAGIIGYLLGTRNKPQQIVIVITATTDPFQIMTQTALAIVPAIEPTAIPTSTLTATPTSTLAPTNTPYPTSIPIPVLFEDDFSNGLSPNWTVLSGEPLIVNHSLTASTPTWLMIGDSSWKNYEITLKAQNNECWMYDGNGGDTLKAAIGVRATDSNNMVAYEWANCEQNMAFVTNGSWNIIPNAIINDYDSNVVRDIKITVQDNQITVVVDNVERSSIVNTKSTSGGVILIIPGKAIITDFKVIALP